ncbi:hypothetical protein ALC60_09318 [Trachymyrmex zeteki]|uniref:Uncharacterized protein n=1 Tax=Mycetomoellerius zeteki TaxID=64791 RepID=A0A151WUD7_9HYME|nr:hypothetical protein ALC60_09318 [Trachymyrmex zeteki]
MGVKPFRPTEGKHAEETQLRPKGRLSAFNDKKARQPIQCKSRDVISDGCATRRQVLAGVNAPRHLKCMVTDRGVFIGRSRNGARQQYKSNRSELECRVDDTVRERDARHSNKWIDSCKLRIRPYLSIGQFLRLIVTLTYPVRGNSSSSNSSCNPPPRSYTQRTRAAGLRVNSCEEVSRARVEGTKRVGLRKGGGGRGEEIALAWHQGEEGKGEREYCEAAESRKNYGKGRSASGERGSRFREIGVKTSGGEHAREEEKYSRDRRGQVQRQGGRISKYRSWVVPPPHDDEERLSKRPCLFTLGRAFR